MNIVIYDSRGKDKYLYPVYEIHYEDDEIYLVTVLDWNNNKQKAILYKYPNEVVSKEFEFYDWVEIVADDINISESGEITIFSDNVTPENLLTLKKHLNL